MVDVGVFKWFYKQAIILRHFNCHPRESGDPGFYLAKWYKAF
jgi:hypothetical protein